MKKIGWSIVLIMMVLLQNGWAQQTIGKQSAIKPEETETQIEQVCENLTADDENIRMEAEQALEAIDDKTVVPLLLKVCPRGKEAIYRLSSNHAVPALLEALHNENEGVRDIAAEALGGIHSQLALSALMKLLQDEKGPVRAGAAFALGGMGNKAATPMLIKVLSDQDSDVRGRAARALGKIGDKASIPALLKVLQDEDPWFRGAAADSLGMIGDRSATKSLLQALHDDDAVVRMKVAVALGEIGDNIAVPDLLLSASHDEDPWVCRYAIEALGKIGDKTAVTELLKMLQSEESDGLGDALGDLGDKSIVPALLEVLYDENSGIDARGDAAWALGKIGDSAIIPALLKLSGHQDAGVRGWAVTALGMIGDKTAVPALLEALYDEDAWVRECAAEALAEIGDQAAVPALIEALPKIGEKPGRRGWEDENEPVRISAAEGLGKIGDKTAVPALIKALHDDADRVRIVAIEALGKIGDKNSASALLKLLQDETRWVRGNAAAALGAINDPTLASPLLTSFYDTGNVQAFNVLRHNLLFPENLKDYRTVSDPFRRAGALYLLALKAREDGDYQQSLTYAEQARTFLSPHIHTALTILTLWLQTQAELKLGRPQQAFLTITQAEELFGDLCPQERDDYRELFEECTYLFKGDAFNALGKKEQAVATYQGVLETIALNKRRREYYVNPIYTMYTDVELIERLEAMLRTQLGILQIESGKQNLEQAVQLGEAYQAGNSLEMENEEQRYTELACQKMAEGDYEGAQILIEELNLRRQNYLNRRADLKLADPAKQQVVDLYKQRQHQIENLNLQIAQPALDEIKRKALEAQRSQAKRELQQYLTELKQTHPDLATLLGAKPIELAAIQEKLPEDTAILQYLVLPDKTIVFVIKTASIEVVDLRISQDALRTKIEQFRRTLIASRGQPRGLRRVDGGQASTFEVFQTISHELYDILIKPVADRHLSGVMRIGIAPNSFLHYLPFEALINGERYLLDMYQVFYINSTSILWIASEQTLRHQDTAACLLAFGNPDGSLRYADSEVDQIARLFAQKTVYHRTEAKKELVKTAYTRNCILHFATHGMFQMDNSIQNYLLLADGNLTIEEIWGLPLKGVRLTTLSACETGLGNILSGDDVISLENAFIFAGSPSVIATLWKVDDQGTAVLMEMFYQNLAQGKTKAEALQLAKMGLSKQGKYSHPYYWAAFTLRGVWN